MRRKVSGKTKQEVRDKLNVLQAELDAGVKSSAAYTVQAAMDAWLEHGLSGRSARTVQLYRDSVKPLMEQLGTRSLRRLSVADVRSALSALNEQLSTRSLQIAHNCLVRADSTCCLAGSLRAEGRATGLGGTSPGAARRSCRGRLMPLSEMRRQVAAIVLRAAAGHGFALGGGNALIQHGVISRPTQDVELFTGHDGPDGDRVRFIRSLPGA